MKIRKAVIPAAGLGIRFLPATKTIPKEMLPIVDKPTILYSIEEIIEADIPEVVLIAGRDKTSVEDYFDTSFELEDVLEKAGKRDLLKSIQAIRKRIKIITIRQQEALGLGHAISCVEPIVGKEPFAVLLSDEIMISEVGKPSAIGQLLGHFEKTGNSCVSVIEVAADQIDKYGILEASVLSPGFWDVHAAFEKPAIAKTNSGGLADKNFVMGQSGGRLALTGRHVFDSEIFSCLREIKPDVMGAYNLTDAMSLLAKRQKVTAMTVQIIILRRSV